MIKGVFVHIKFLSQIYWLSGFGKYFIVKHQVANFLMISDFKTQSSRSLCLVKIIWDCHAYQTIQCSTSGWIWKKLLYEEITNRGMSCNSLCGIITISESFSLCHIYFSCDKHVLSNSGTVLIYVKSKSDKTRELSDLKLYHKCGNV